ncbi:DUF3304 domain-containing protein [Pseudomonas guariconensis]|nr:DUF3304 domain-containing protein [Pseudomonas putida]MCO7568291.1 DUF3304 domain-containing protein [Pseudomonas mosselii]MCO7608417.1 DUF3304 domain-containing protein [Pseudomonas guariconensis]
MGFLFLNTAGCSLGEPEYLAGDLWAVNHTSAAINHFAVNGFGGGEMPAHMEMGEGLAASCCLVSGGRVWR